MLARGLGVLPADKQLEELKGWLALMAAQIPGAATQTNVSRKNPLKYEKFCNGFPMGEVIEFGTGMGSGFGLVSALFSLAALGLYAVMQGSNENDDDDSSPGGGLMQPVAGAA